MPNTANILRFYWHLYNQLLKVKSAFSLETMIGPICWDLNFTNISNFQSLEVVDRGSETQLQVIENKIEYVRVLRVYLVKR